MIERERKREKERGGGGVTLSGCFVYAGIHTDPHRKLV